MGCIWNTYFSFTNTFYYTDREVVFQCRDEGPLRAKVAWRRPNGQSLPPGSVDRNGRLEIPDIKVQDSGTYICIASGYPPGTPGAEVTVELLVSRCKYYIILFCALKFICILQNILCSRSKGK